MYTCVVTTDTKFKRTTTQTSCDIVGNMLMIQFPYQIVCVEKDQCVCICDYKFDQYINKEQHMTIMVEKNHKVQTKKCNRFVHNMFDAPTSQCISVDNYADDDLVSPQHSPNYIFDTLEQ
ncbi:Hypothetical_protein [Hexamita inflata]|uniref:Hypothetical_protein n=1 Tax=Hexamita inflata TaxID=28002 RepID=A0AA86PG94_9EUKA|nr:Hypothetical protein HINF_LOCUS25452 [Hexamita inflata]